MIKKNDVPAETPAIPEIGKSQMYFGLVYHWVIIVSCLVSLITPVFILLFPDSNIMNPNIVFSAVFEGKRASEIWEAAGADFNAVGFWKLLAGNILSPDGFAMFGITLGCSVALWALVPAACRFIAKRNWFYAAVCFFIMALMALAMSGITG